MALLPIPTLSHKQFMYHKGMKEISAEVSELPGLQLYHLYDDAADVGIAIKGKKETVYFHLTKVENETEDDTLAWIFEPISEHVRRNPALEGHTLVIFND